MAIHPDLVAMMTDTIVVRQATTYSGAGYGIPTLDAGVSHKAFVQKKTRVIRTADGGATTSDYDAYTDSILTNISQEDVIEFDGKRFMAVSVDVYRDEEGPHHTVLGLQAIVNPA